MSTKFTRLDARWGIIEYPITLADMEQIILEFPKTERKFYEFAIKALKKVMKDNVKIFAFTSAAPKLTKTGFIVVAQTNLFLVSLTGGLFGGAEAETIKYGDIKKVDSDIIPAPFGIANTHTASLELEVKGMIGTKKRVIRSIANDSIDMIVKAVRDRIEMHERITKH